jgi:hypothetical protein
MTLATRPSSLPLFGPNGPSLALSRRDYRTQPGVLTQVLTPGNTPTPRPALPVRRSSGMRDEGGKGRKIFLIDGSLGKALGTAATPVLPPLQGGTFIGRHLGLKPRAESYYPFGICSTSPYWTVYLGPNTDANRQLPDQERQSK